MNAATIHNCVNGQKNEGELKIASKLIRLVKNACSLRMSVTLENRPTGNSLSSHIHSF